MLGRLKRLFGFGPNKPRVHVSADEVATPVEGEDLLLISDLHLGEACKEHSRIEYLKRGAEFDAHICAFLEHYTAHRPNDRPWRLILGGDLIDFLQVTIVPDGADAEAQRFGLTTREADSAWKLRRLMERHRRVFVFLADFIGAGNRVEVVQGNHDEEMFWPAVRRTLIDGLVQLYFGDERTTGADPDAFRGRVHFNSWFYYQPGLLYVEHGHRFDEFCATPPQMCPMRPHGEEELTTPMSGLAIRYFANLERGFKTHDKEHWRFPDYLRYYGSRGSLVRAVLDVAGRYVNLVGRAIVYHLEHGRFHSEQAVATHRLHAAEFVDRGTLDASQLDALEALSARSVMSSPLGIYTILGGAEISGALIMIATLFLLLATGWGWGVDLTVLGSVMSASYAWVRWARRQFPTDIQRKLDDKAEAISRILEVPVVAMGHCHRPRRRRMSWNHRRFYVNTGNFIHPESARHLPEEPCNCPTTFVVLHGPGRKAVNPRLMRWCCVDQRPLAYEGSG